MVLKPLNIRQNGDFSVLSDESHGHSGDGALNRNTGVHHRKTASADARHGAGAVGFQYVGYNADDVGEFFLRGEYGAQSAFRECSVSDFAPAGAAHGAHFSDRIGGEVVMQDKALGWFIPFQPVEHLVIGSDHAEGGDGERLCLPAGKER